MIEKSEQRHLKNIIASNLFSHPESSVPYSHFHSSSSSIHVQLQLSPSLISLSIHQPVSHCLNSCPFCFSFTSPKIKKIFHPFISPFIYCSRFHHSHPLCVFILFPFAHLAKNETAQVNREVQVKGQTQVKETTLRTGKKLKRRG